MSKDPKDRPAYVIVYAAVIAAVFTGAIMALHGVTQPLVERNEQLFEQKAMVELFGLGDVETLSDQEIVDLYDTRIRREPDLTDPRTNQTFEIYTAVDEDGQTIGQAFSFSGTGFWARIDGFLAFGPSSGEIIGITFLQHQETPGLGGRITERAWRQQFAGIWVVPRPGDTGEDGEIFQTWPRPRQERKYIYIGGEAPQPGSLRYGRHVDAISGATGTSTAVERFLNEQIAAYNRAFLDAIGAAEISY